jgi:hypothetical protein
MWQRRRGVKDHGDAPQNASWVTKHSAHCHCALPFIALGTPAVSWAKFRHSMGQSAEKLGQQWSQVGQNASNREHRRHGHHSPERQLYTV